MEGLEITAMVVIVVVELVEMFAVIVTVSFGEVTPIEVVDSSKEVVGVEESVEVAVVAIIIVCSEMLAAVILVITVRL